MQTTFSPQAFSFVSCDPGPNVSEYELNEWYNTEHAPARANTPGISSVLRYKASLPRNPNQLPYLATHSVASLLSLESDIHRALTTSASNKEIDIVNRMTSLDERVYSLISSRGYPVHDARDVPRYLLTVQIQVTPDTEDFFNAWYEQEHMMLISQIPGWVSGRRFKLVTQEEVAGGGNSSKPAPPKYLAVHEWTRTREEVEGSQSWAHALTTDWTNEVRKGATQVEIDWWEVVKTF